MAYVVKAAASQLTEEQVIKFVATQVGLLESKDIILIY